MVSHGYGSTTTFVPANSEQAFNVTDTTNISVRELPKGATKLFDHDTVDCESAGDKTAGYAQAVNSDIAEAGLDHHPV